MSSPQVPSWLHHRKSLGQTYGNGAFHSLRQSKQPPLNTEVLDSYDGSSAARKNFKVDKSRLSHQLHSQSTAPPLPEESPMKVVQADTPLKQA